MAGTFTPQLRLLQQAIGSNPRIWGSVWNSTVTDLLDTAIAGVSNINLASGSVTLTTGNGTADTSRAAILRATGAVADSSVIMPTIDRLYVAFNDTAYTITFKTSTATGIAVPAGKAVYLVVQAVDGSVREVNYTDSYVYQGTQAASVSVPVNSTSGVSADVVTMVEGTMAYMRIGVHGGSFTGTDWVIPVFDYIDSSLRIADSSSYMAQPIYPIDVGPAVRQAFATIDKVSEGNAVRIRRFDGVAWGVGTRNLVTGITLAYTIR